MALKIISRAEAQARGLRHFFTGIPCKRGHLVQRFTKHGHCSECSRLRGAAKYRGEIFEAVTAKDERAVAKAAGLKTYWTGKPCSKGHIAERYTSGARCVVCSPLIGAKWQRDNKDRRKKITREYFQRYKKVCVERCARWFEKNRDKFRLYMREAYQENPEKFLVHGRNRRARKLAAGGTHTEADIKDIFRLQRGRCAYCKISVKDDYHVDHIISIVTGGPNDRKNLQILCPTCNHKKHAKDPIDFAREIGMLI